MHLEDQLQSIYLKSKLLAEYIKVHHRVFSHELASLHEYVIYFCGHYTAHAVFRQLGLNCVIVR